ncbi:drug/metabolite transporter (DMT)-like permease [Streptacidiphilus sp. MAP12-33]|uniref:DMT family transporter n=1 Tax=Streptacidiphilus sp. MAP12-33 TaxID=3156266 RepID=UPI003517006D
MPATPASAPARARTTHDTDPRASAAAPRRRGVDWRVKFAALSLIWGFSFLFMKVGNRGFAPLQVTFGRLAAGSAVLLVVLVARRQPLPRGVGLWVRLAVAAFLLNALPFALFAYSEQRIPSQLAGICNATSPLWGMLLSVVALSEDRPSRRRVAGLGLGFLGVLTVLGAWQGFHGVDPLGAVLALAASLSYPVGWIWVRRTLAGRPESHLTLTTGQLLLGTAQLGIVTVFATHLPAGFALAPTLSVLALGVLGTGLAFLLQYGLVAEVGPTTAQTVTYLTPLVATVAGVTLLGEALHWNTLVGAVIVLLGAALVQRAR